MPHLKKADIGHCLTIFLEAWPSGYSKEVNKSSSGSFKRTGQTICFFQSKCMVQFTVLTVRFLNNFFSAVWFKSFEDENMMLENIVSHCYGIVRPIEKIPGEEARSAEHMKIVFLWLLWEVENIYNSHSGFSRARYY